LPGKYFQRLGKMFPERFDSGNCRSVRILSLLAAIFLVLAVSPGTAPQASETAERSHESPAYDSSSFIDELGRLKTELGNARSTDEIRAYRESLPHAWIVEAGARRFKVPTDLLVARLERAEKQPELRLQQIDRARDYLGALASETASLSAQPPLRADSAQATLDAILARPEYTHSRHQTWWERLRQQIDETILDVLRRVLSRVGGQKDLGQFLLWIGVCGAAILIAYWLFHRWFRAAQMEEMAIESAQFSARSWQQWVFASRAAADRHDYRLAIHCAYWAGIARLQELGTIAPDRANTPREYLRSFAKSNLVLPETYALRYQALSALTSRLETKWYGCRIATEADFRDSLAQLEILGCHLP
jgi:hypothetical protein